MTDYAGEASITKKVATSAGSHNLTLGTFIGRSEADDINYQYRVVSEFNNNPRMVDINYTDAAGNNVIYSQNGVNNRIGMASNRFLRQNRTAFYLTDEIIANKWRFDLGFRYERTTGDFNDGSIVESQVYDNPELSANLANVRFADGSFTTASIDASAWALSLAGLYELSATTNAYVNLSRGYFFPQFRGFAPIASGITGTEFKAETILQAEGGLKFGNDKLSGSAAVYYVTLQDRINIRNSFSNGILVPARRDEQTTATLGLEANIDYRVSDDFSLRGSLTYQNHEITKNLTTDLINGGETRSNEGNELARQPNLLAFVGLYYDNSQFDAFATVNYTGKKFASDNNNIELDAISLLRIGAGYSIDIGDNGETLRLGFNVFNLGDSQGITEGNPRALNQTEEAFFFGRPILPRRIFFTGTFNF